MSEPESEKRLDLRVTRYWPSILIVGGLVLYAAACIGGDALPFEAVFVGPVVMLSGLILRAKRR